VKEHRLRIGDRDVTLVSGPAGWGECSPLPGYPCDPAAAWAAAREAACDGWPEATRDTVAVNALVETPAIDPASLAGYPAVKVKVGRREPHADVELVAAVRDAIGPSVALRIDANGGWDVDTAADVITRLARYDLELVEQPVASLDDLARVRRRVNVPIAADESVRSVEDARRLAASDAADAVVLKVQALGGVRPALRVADAAGVPAVVTSMRETSVGIAAGLALAAALPELPYASGLAARMPGGDVVRDPLVPDHGLLRVRRVEPDLEMIARYEVAGHEVRS
jgi:O-succinylbenzoate synthase